jgi:hypothetical protein
VDRVPVPGTDNSTDRAVIYKTPNGHLWTSVMNSRSPAGLWVNRSRDNGVTWDGPVNLLVPNEKGDTGLVHFSHAGRTYLGVAAAEDGKAANSRFRFLYIDQDDPRWMDPSAWTDDSAAIPPFHGEEHADDELSIIRDRHDNVYLAAETEPGPNGSKGDPQLVLYKRTAAGSWSEVVITRHRDGTKPRKRPTVAIHGGSETLLVFTSDQSRTEISYASAPLADLSQLATKPMTIVTDAAGKSFRNNLTPRFATTSESGLLVMLDNLTDRTLWRQRLP